MTSDTASWWKGQLSFPNVLAVGTIVVGLTAQYKATEAKNEIQDLKISGVEKRLDVSDAVFIRRDITEQRLTNIEANLIALDKKLDSIRRVVR